MHTLSDINDDDDDDDFDDDTSDDFDDDDEHEMEHAILSPDEVRRLEAVYKLELIPDDKLICLLALQLQTEVKQLKVSYSQCYGI